jgi:CHASE3 domain sensor protein
MRGKIIAGFGLAFAVLAAAVLVAYQSTQRLIAGGQSVAHTQEVLTELRTIQSLIQEAESAVRGYLLTGNPKFLEPYVASARRIHPQIGRMRALTADDSWQEVPLRRLEARIEEKLAWNSRAISRRPGQDPAAARATIESSEAGRLMEQIGTACASCARKRSGCSRRGRRTRNRASTAHCSSWPAAPSCSSWCSSPFSTS